MERFIELSKADALKYKQYLITPWSGIDPVETKDGRWVLPESVLPHIEKLRINVNSSIDSVIKATNVKANLDKMNIIELDIKKDFPEPVDPTDLQP